MVDRRTPADSASPGQDFLVGKLLIAMPNMGDPRFEKSVVFMCAHDKDHAMGVVINKPLTDVTLGDLLEQLEIKPRAAMRDKEVFFGGPVSTNRGMVIHSLDYRSNQTLVLSGEVGLTASRDILQDIAGETSTKTQPSQFRFAIGYAGWGAGQLEQEIAANAWVHTDAARDLIFAEDAQSVWRDSLARLGVTQAMLSPEWSEVRKSDQPLN